ncbi:MAG: CDP-alcohol phosphatidyltransferase family protein [Actinomycetota bacterium]|nr:CDP-alcohol phosphatidyltransferase family protein [Actinomycetota bacterium]
MAGRNLTPSAEVGSPERPSDAVLTVPNLITFSRLALVPVFVWLALGAGNVAAAFWLGFFIGASDFADGLAARRLHQVSKLGATLDPLFDRVAIAAWAWVLLGLHLVPWLVIAVVLLRDIALLASNPFLARRGVERPPVSKMGKWGSFGTMYSFGVFLLSAVVTGDATHYYRALAWWTYFPAAFFSYVAAVGYAGAALKQLRVSRASG